MELSQKEFGLRSLKYLVPILSVVVAVLSLTLVVYGIVSKTSVFNRSRAFLNSTSSSNFITLRAIGLNGLALPRAKQIFLSTLSYIPRGTYSDDTPKHDFVGLTSEPLQFSAYIEVPGYGNLDFTAAAGGAGFLPRGQTLDVLYEVARHRVLAIEKMISVYRSQGLSMSADFDSKLSQAKQKFTLASAETPGSAKQAQLSLESLQISGPLGEDVVVSAGQQLLDRRGRFNADQFISTFTRYAGDDTAIYEKGKSMFSGAVAFNNWQYFTMYDEGPEHVYPVPHSDLYTDAQYIFPRVRVTPGIWLTWLPEWVTHDNAGLALVTTSLTNLHSALAKTLVGAKYWQILSEPHSWDDQGFIQPNQLIQMSKSVHAAIKAVDSKFETGINVALPWGEDAAQNYYRNEPPTRLCQYWSASLSDHYYSTACKDNVPGYVLENSITVGYLYQNPHPGTIRLCQYWSQGNQDHLYSTSCQDNIAGYTLENHVTVGYVYQTPQPNTIRLCQYWNSGIKDHSYSTSCQNNIPGYQLENSITTGYIFKSPELSPTYPQVLSPYEFLQFASNSGLNYDFIVLQLYPLGRDMFELEQLLQTFATLGKPIHVELDAPASNTTMPGYQRTEFCDASGDCRHPSQKYYSWRGGWSEANQSLWLQRMFYTLMSKTNVREFNWWDVKDYADVYLPWGGLIDKDNRQRQAYTTLLDLAQRYSPPERLQRRPLCQYWNSQSKDHRYHVSCQNDIPGFQLELTSGAFVDVLPSNTAGTMPLCEFWNESLKDHAYGYCQGPPPASGYTIKQVAGYAAILGYPYPPGQTSAEYCQYWGSGNQDYSYSRSCQNNIVGYQLSPPAFPIYVFTSK